MSEKLILDIVESALVNNAQQFLDVRADLASNIMENHPFDLAYSVASGNKNTLVAAMDYHLALSSAYLDLKYGDEDAVTILLRAVRRIAVSIMGDGNATTGKKLALHSAAVWLELALSSQVSELDQS